MTFAGAITSTRRVPPSHRPWSAHNYQRQAVEHLLSAHAAALFLDPGLGKTSIVLKAFDVLRSKQQVKTMLVVAPLRVCQTVWRQEASKWTDFRHLSFVLLHGDKKDERLREQADVYLINPEGVAWLAKKFFGCSLPFDVVVIDELTKFKNSQAVRSKALRPKLHGVKARWGLTGTPAPNGYMDLFGQFLMLDDGAALGKYVTHYRDQYFQIGYDGFTYTLMPGADKRIEARIAPYVLRMSDEDYLTLPPLVPDIRHLDMDPATRKLYDAMAAHMIAELPGGVVEAGNAAAVYAKLKQMANGAVYMSDSPSGGQKRVVFNLHTVKIEAIEELLDELAGQQLLLAYEFNHDIERLAAHFGSRLAVLRAGASEQETQRVVTDWNAGRIQFLACHPASAAHGLNLQESACAHLAWFCPIWDLELYQQFIRRVRRQGNEAQRVVNHIFVMRDTLDEDALDALSDKDTTQKRLLTRLNAILHKAETPAAGEHAATGVNDMALKLPRADTAAGVSQPNTGAHQSQQGSTGGAPQHDEAPRRVVPAGWGRPATEAAPASDGGQSERTAALLADTGLPNGAAAFSQSVQEHMHAIGTEQPRNDPPEVIKGPEAAPFDGGKPVQEVLEPEAKRATRSRAASKPAETGSPTDEGDKARAHDERTQAKQARLACLQLAWSAAEGDVAAALEVAKLLSAYVMTGE